MVATPWTWYNYRLTHSASELSGFTCTSSVTMNEKFQYRTRPPSAVLKNFEFIVNELVQVNPDNSLAECVNFFIIHDCNQAKYQVGCFFYRLPIFSGFYSFNLVYSPWTIIETLVNFIIFLLC